MSYEVLLLGLLVGVANYYELTRHLAQKSRFIKEKMTGQHRNMLAFLASRSAQPMS